MSYWDSQTMGLIYLVYGLAFFVLGVVAWMLPKRNTTWYHFAPHLSLLAAFGILHGIVEFIEMQRLSHSAEWLTGLSRLLLAASYLSLLEFGRRTWVVISRSTRLSAPWVYGIAILGVVMLSQWTSDPFIGLAVGARWFIGAPAAMLTGLALFAVQRKIKTTGRNANWLRLVALAYICYSVLNLVPLQSDPYLPSWLPTQASFLALFDLPIQLLRTLCAVAATFGLVLLVRLAGDNCQVDATIFESHEPIVITDINSVILRINKAFTASTGYTVEDIVGRKINLLKSGRHDDAFYAAMRESINRTETWQGEIWDRRKNGENFLNRLTVSTVKDAAGAVIYYVGMYFDITDRQKIQQLLQDKEQMLSEAQRIGHVGSWSMELATGNLSWSEELYRIYGVTPETFGHSEQAFLNLIHPDDHAAMKRWLSDCRTGKEWRELDFRIIRPDSSVRFIRGSGGLQGDEINHPLRMVGIAQDITERKQMEKELKASEATFRSIIEVSPVPMVLDDEQFNITFLNPAFVKTFGYDFDDIPTIDDWWTKAYPDPDYRQWAKDAWYTTLKKSKRKKAGLAPMEVAIRCKNNSIKTVLVSVAAVHHDSASLYLVILYDITQRKQMETKLNAIFNAAAEGIITVDMTGNIVSANTAVETIFGYKPDELLGCSIDKLMPSSPRPINDGCLPPTMQSVGRIREIEGLRKNGSAVPLDLSMAEFSIDSAQYFTHIVRDVSLRKYQEQQDKTHLDELAHVTRLGLMGEMASGIAHEVNQPLTAISSYTQVSLNLVNTENPDLVKLTEVLSKTQQQALRAGKIIHRMREFVKSHAKHRSTADVNSLIHDTLDMCIAELKQSDIELTVELEHDLPPVYVDHIQIEQVLINLIRNSIDALLSLPAKQQRQLSIHSHLVPNKGIQVRVKDNGPGLDEDQQQKISAPFYTTKTNGMGMGLSISRSLIEAHEGMLHFNSEPGKGTTFYFTLPLEKSDVP
ncbi:PAS domain S-box protein [Methylobacter svalbardensis]|uniref:PAS domain S-box protein n=1 Tax=Methylobacter svalbardensis TaxID=3080016 RepID=UPI0030EC24AC